MQVDSSREAVHGILQELWEAGVEEYIKAGQPHVKYLPQLMVDEGNASCWISVMDYKDSVGRGGGRGGGSEGEGEGRGVGGGGGGGGRGRGMGGGGRDWKAGGLDGVGKRLDGKEPWERNMVPHVLQGLFVRAHIQLLVCEHCVLLEE